jgi:serine protease AprX
MVVSPVEHDSIETFRARGEPVMKRAIRHLPFGLAIVVAILAAPNAPMRAAGSHASSQHRIDRLDAKLRTVIDDAAPKPQRVIIRVRPGSRPALRDALTNRGVQILQEHESIDAITSVVNGDELAGLADNDAVLSISADAIVRPHSLLGGLVGGLLNTVTTVVNVVGDVLLPNGADTSGPEVPPAVLRQTLGVDNTTWAGRGIGVAVIDSGLEMSAEFQNRVTKFVDFTKGGIVTTPYDDYGHGTHVAGTIGGSGALSYNNAYRGLAPSVKFTVLKVLDKNGAGYTSDVISAIDYAVANRAALGIDIINLSLGHPIFEPAGTDPLVQAVERASKAGIVVVAAAGNYGKNPTTGQTGYAGITSPGNAPSAITVGAVKTQDTVSRGDDRIADYSSAGPTWYDAYVKPDIVAPGHNIVAVAAKKGTLYQTYPQLKSADGDYMRLSGTSMATAVTTGSVALILEANRKANGYPYHPSLTPNAVKGILQYTSFSIHDDAGIQYDPLRAGAGSLNAKGGIDLGRTINTAAPRGSYWLTSTPYTWTTIGDQTLAWNQAIIWGNAIIWGSTTSVNETAWGSAIIWGSSTSWSSAIIWGSSDLVWSDPQSWGEAIIWGSSAVGTDNGSAIIWGSSAGMTSQNTAWKSLATSTTATGTSVGQ